MSYRLEAKFGDHTWYGKSVAELGTADHKAYQEAYNAEVTRHLEVRDDGYVEAKTYVTFPSKEAATLFLLRWS